MVGLSPSGAVTFDPTRSRGKGADDMLLTRNGLWIASDNFDGSQACGGVIKPGSSPGRLTIGGNVTMSATPAIYYWELAANTTSGAGANWSQIQMTSGDLNVQTGAIFLPAFTGTATQPAFGDAFWSGSHRWDNVIDLIGTATNTGGNTAFVIDNSAWGANAGNFIAGWLGSFWSSMDKMYFFLMIASVAALAGIVIAAFNRPLGKILR